MHTILRSHLPGSLGAAPEPADSSHSFSKMLVTSAASMMANISGSLRGSQAKPGAFLETRILKNAVSRGGGSISAKDSSLKRVSGVSIGDSRGSTRISEIIQTRQQGRTSVSVSSRHSSTALKR